jgi:hypothetical protein
MGNSDYDLFTCVYSLGSTYVYPQNKTVMTTTNILIVTEEEWLVLSLLVVAAPVLAFDFCIHNGRTVRNPPHKKEK